MAAEELKSEQEAQLAKEQRKMKQQRQVSKVLLDGLYDQDSNISSLRGSQNVMRVIWHACSGFNKLSGSWEDFLDEPSAPEDTVRSISSAVPSSSALSVGTQTD